MMFIFKNIFILYKETLSIIFSLHIHVSYLHNKNFSTFGNAKFLQYYGKTKKASINIFYQNFNRIFLNNFDNFSNQHVVFQFLC